jgi:hypothetical protein
MKISFSVKEEKSLSFTMCSNVAKYAYLYFNFEEPDTAALAVHETGIDNRQEEEEEAAEALR